MEEKIEYYMNSLVNDGVFPGACYAFFYKGNSFKGCVGKRSLFPSEENSIDTIYDAASLTKMTVTNPLIALAIHNKKIKPTDKFKKYFVEFPFEEINIKQLLTHTSGLSAKYNKNTLSGRHEVLTNLELPIKPGTKIEYRDVNFLLLGFLVEKIYGNTLDVLAKKYIFEPLGMKDTMFLPANKELCAPTEKRDGKILRGVVHDEKANILGGIAGNAGVFTTIDDISRFVSMIIKNDGSILPKNVINSWFKISVNDGSGIKRSYGWVIGSTINDTKTFASESSIFHTGYVGNEIFIDRGLEYAFVLLSNRVHPTRDNTLLIDRRAEINETCYKIITENNK